MKNVSPTARMLARKLFRRNGRDGKPIRSWSSWDYDYIYGALHGAYDYAYGMGDREDGRYFHRIIMKLIRSRMPRVPRNQQQKEAA